MVFQLLLRHYIHQLEQATLQNIDAESSNQMATFSGK